MASKSKHAKKIIEKLKIGQRKNISERSMIAQDKDGGGGVETLRCVVIYNEL